jgi:hypothetical protein
MTKTILWCGAILAVLVSPAAAQFQDPTTGEEGRFLTGEVRTDLFASVDPRPWPQEGTSSGEAAQHKSPWVAAGLSLVLPGSGEFYAGSYWKSALFLAIEVGAWTLAAYYDRQGDAQTASFEQYADAHWSVAQYADYSVSNLIAPDRRSYYETNLYLPPESQGVQPWEKINWDVLNAMEREIAGYYSHLLPPHGDQQYFEMIGKYPQFNQGWDDANLQLPPDYETMKANLTPHFLAYGDQRAAANDQYAKATTFVTVAVINHVVSAIDAAFTATSANRAHARARIHTVPGPYGVVPVAAIGVEWPI